MTKKTKKEKVLKVQIEQPKIEIAPETYKKQPVNPESKPLPVNPAPKVVVNPNNPKIEGIDTGFKKPSITNVKYAYTKEQYKTLIENYKKENPAKYELKKSELAAKLANIKE